MLRTLTDRGSQKKTLEAVLVELVHEIEEDRYMLLEYLGPVVDGCRAALSVSLDRAREARFSDEDIQEYITAAGNSFEDITICFNPTDSSERYSVVFDGTKVYLADDCEDVDVVISGATEAIRDLLDVDSKSSPVDELGVSIDVSASEPRDALVGLGLLCFPSLLRMARSGVDPSSLLAEDADAVIIAAASDLVTKMVRRWIDLQLASTDRH